MLEIILGIVVFISILLIIIILINNKFKLAIIKIDKAQEDISLYLQKKEELLNRTKQIIKKELKLKEFLQDLDTISVEASNFDVHMQLKKAYNEFFNKIDENEKLLKSKSMLSILDELDENEENIVGSIRFYNDTVVDYNQLVISFPSNIVAFFGRYKKKSFYNNEKRDITDIKEY